VSGILNEPVTTLSYGWTLERSDGAGIALTSHDQAWRLGSLVLQPAPGIVPSAVERTGGLEEHAAEAGGALSARALTEADLTAGRWDGARSHLFAASWSGGSDERVTLSRGELGAIGNDGDAFSADLLGAAARLSQPVCPLTSPECRAEFGDPSCRVDLSGRSKRATVIAVDEERISLNIIADEKYVNGNLRFWSGGNAGLRSTIIGIDQGQFILRESARAMVAVGDHVTCHEGCDKTFGTCRTRFNNAINFQGEPHLPGNDLLTSYPGE
jgi:uncharacterized phage protein (TIGR02218 family)